MGGTAPADCSRCCLMQTCQPCLTWHLLFRFILGNHWYPTPVFFTAAYISCVIAAFIIVHDCFADPAGAGMGHLPHRNKSRVFLLLDTTGLVTDSASRSGELQTGAWVGFGTEARSSTSCRNSITLHTTTHILP